LIDLEPDRLAAEAGAEIVARGESGSPGRASVDTREVGRGDLFFGLRGESRDGGEFAAEALKAGAWGVVVTPEHARELSGGWVLAAPDPLAALQQAARAWRRELGCPAVGITGSTGKTSVKDICRALLPGRVHASPENLNTEIGLPLAVLEAPRETDALVLEMAMRGRGQIAELAAIAEPDVGAITNVGPVHLELLETVEAIVETKAELVAALRDGGTAVIPAESVELRAWVPDTVRTIAVGAGGDVEAVETLAGGREIEALIRAPGEQQRFRFPFTEAYNVANAVCAVAIGVALGVSLAELAQRTGGITFSRLRGELIELGDDVIVVNDCYNANPISMRAALDHLASLRRGRKIAVLGEMAELGPDAESFHHEVGRRARELGVDMVVGVGDLGRAYEPDRYADDAEAAVEVVTDLLAPGDTILVKGSRAVGLEAVAARLSGETS
jgi:UDP-N-acetylmuramoyl-tripeptide--D-alanyl-D-alanine ligase